MLTFAYRNHVIGIIIIFAIISIGVVEIFSMTHEVLHDTFAFLFRLIFLLFDWIEFGTEGFFERVFHLKHHHAELATFYTLLTAALLLIAYLYFTLPSLYRKLFRNLKARWLKRKRQTIFFWRSMSVFKKIQWLTISLVGATGMLLFV